MRRLVHICCALVLALSASAELRRSDVLLTNTGSFYRIDTMNVQTYNEAHPDSQITASAMSVLVLTIQSGEQTETVPVPASFTGMVNLEPSIGYDPTDERVYVFWQRKPSPSSSELLLTSYKDGVWTEPTTFDSGIWRMQFNLRIAFTHYATSTDEEGGIVRTPATIAHAVWWEQYGTHEAARYAMLDLDDGVVTGYTIRDMSELSTLEEALVPRPLSEDFDKESFRTPFILDTPGSDSVDILFADWYTNYYEIVNVRPMLDENNGVIHIPIGVTTGVMDAPVIRVRDVDVGLKAITASSPNGGRDLLIYSSDQDAVEYVIYRDGAWSLSGKVVLGENVSQGEATSALRRNIERN